MCPACQRPAPVGIQCVDCVNEAVAQRGPLVLSEEHDRAHWFSPAEAAERLRDRFARELCDAIAALEPPVARAGG